MENIIIVRPETNETPQPFPFLGQLSERVDRMEQEYNQLIQKIELNQ